MKVKCPTGRASFWIKFPTIRSKTPVKCPGYALRRVLGSFGLDWYISEHRGRTMCQVVANMRLKQWKTKRLSTSPLIKNLPKRYVFPTLKNGTSDTRLGVMKEWTSIQSPGEGRENSISWQLFTSSILAYIKFSYCSYGFTTKKFL